MTIPPRKSMTMKKRYRGALTVMAAVLSLAACDPATPATTPSTTAAVTVSASPSPSVAATSPSPSASATPSAEPTTAAPTPAAPVAEPTTQAPEPPRPPPPLRRLPPVPAPRRPRRSPPRRPPTAIPAPTPATATRPVRYAGRPTSARPGGTRAGAPSTAARTTAWASAGTTDRPPPVDRRGPAAGPSVGRLYEAEELGQRRHLGTCLHRAARPGRCRQRPGPGNCSSRASAAAPATCGHRAGGPRSPWARSEMLSLMSSPTPPLRTRHGERSCPVPAAPRERRCRWRATPWRLA